MAKKILIVDDEPNIVKMIEARVRSNGYQVVSANDGKSGIEKAVKERPDLIILDILMPEMDGTTMAAALKENPKTKDIPIIFLTCLIEKGEERDTHHLIGGNVFFSKPFDGGELLDKIDEIMNPSTHPRP